MDKLELDDFEFYHSIWFAVLVVILLSVFVFPNQEFESFDWKIIKDNPILTSSTTNLICFFLIATIGVSHGSLDNYKGKKLLKFYSLKNSIIFYLSYIFVALLVILLWKIFPALTLLIFLIIAAYHFGKEDSLKETRQSDLKFFYYFSRGSIIIFAPLAFHTDETIEIFKMISNNLFVDYILNLEKFYFSKFMLSLVLLSSYLISGRRSASFYFEVPSILAINYFFTPFFAFTIYFCFLHSIRHIISLMYELDNNDLKNGFKIFTKKALPLTILTAIFCLIGLYFLSNTYNFNSSILKIIFIGLASLTFPHILLEYLIEKNEK